MKLAITLAACLTAGTASAEFLTGNQLLQLMQSEERHERAAADGYLMGAHDVGRGIVHCTTTGVTLSQIRDMSRQFLIATPAVRHKSADSIVMYVLAEAFPCPKKQSKGSDV